MKKNGKKAYLNDLVGHPLNDDANAAINSYNGARPCLVFPKHNTNLVPYKE